MRFRSAFAILPRWLNYRLAYRKLARPGIPINLTYSITNACHSRCKSCDIYMVYRKDRALFRSELTIDEVEKIFRSIGQVFFLNISGGEPFLRRDIADIIEAGLRHLRPRVIHIPTNAISPDLIRARLGEVLERVRRIAPGTPITVKPSLDGYGALHDEVRGVPGNFALVERTMEVLRELKRDHPNLKIGLGTVVSTLNIHGLGEVFDYVERVNPDSYINEIAEERTEMFNVGRGITPDADTYRRATALFRERMPRFMKGKRGLGRLTMAFRLHYYDLVVRILRERRQVIPCYGGISNVHLSPYGDVWPCCVLGYEKSFGNLRSSEYDFWKIWRSPRAAEVRRYIRERKCACPLANQYYANILLHVPSLLKVLLRYVLPRTAGSRETGADAGRVDRPLRGALPGIEGEAGRREEAEAPLRVLTGGDLRGTGDPRAGRKRHDVTDRRRIGERA